MFYRDCDFAIADRLDRLSLWLLYIPADHHNNFVGLVLFQGLPGFYQIHFPAGVILYNPFFPIYPGDRDIWSVFNVITVAALLAGGIAVIRKLKHKEIKG